MTNYFPHLIWLLRDFSLDFNSESGANTSADDYMEKALLPRDNWEEGSMKRVIRSKFKQVFPRRNCFTLVRPVNDEKLLRRIEEVDYEDLRREFRVELSKLLHFIGSRSAVKKVRGKSLNGKSFCLFLRHIVDSLNSDSFPGISTVDERLRKHQRKQVVKRAQAQFTKLVEKMGNDLPMNESSLGEQLEEVRLQVIGGMQSQWVTGAEWKKAVQELRDKVRPDERKLFEDNMESSRQLNSRIVGEVIEEFQKEVQRLSAELEAIEPKIEDLGIGSGKDEDLESILEQSRLSVVNANPSFLKRRLTRTGSGRERMVDANSREPRSTKSARRSSLGDCSRGSKTCTRATSRRASAPRKSGFSTWNYSRSCRF